MELIKEARQIQDRAESRRANGTRLALVPTMGALHAGHLALVREARRHADDVVVSIFVNPTQFGPHEDFSRYPRMLEDDLDLLRSEGVDAVFAPSVREMYPFGVPPATTVHVTNLDAALCGPHRPGHFEGVCTVVARLLLLVRPHVAVFGRKDAQQLVMIRRMVADLGFDVRVLAGETVREKDGLALSSRNRYLSDDERAAAVCVPQALRAAERLILEGERNSGIIESSMREEIAREPRARLQYAEVVAAGDLKRMKEIENGQEVIAALAVFFGKTRLIDNTFLSIPDAV
ncbi:pantoate--beta-alanine ligase [soil metagenome]